MDELKASLSLLTNGAILLYLLKGLAFTVVIAAIAIIISVILGSVLALVRNYCTRHILKIPKFIATAYIEIFRNTPLMLWIFFCLVYFPAPNLGYRFAQAIGLSSSTDVSLLIKSVVALTLFTSSVMAEIIRGGLNSVDKGQIEAGYAQGFTFIQVLIHIVMPQAYRAIIPTMLSQAITTIKDTSYIANIASIELLKRVYTIVNTATRYTGMPSNNISDYFVLLGLAFVFYFIINFALSCLVRRLQKIRAYNL